MSTIDSALLRLEVELANWPGLILEELSRGHTWSSREPEESIHPDNWFAIVTLREGPRGREHYQGNGHTLLEAIDKLTAELMSRRTMPHKWHVADWMAEGRFVVGCPDCEREAAEIFDGQVEWETESGSLVHPVPSAHGPEPSLAARTLTAEEGA